MIHIPGKRSSLKQLPTPRLAGTPSDLTPVVVQLSRCSCLSNGCGDVTGASPVDVAGTHCLLRLTLVAFRKEHRGAGDRRMTFEFGSLQEAAREVGDDIRVLDRAGLKALHSTHLLRQSDARSEVYQLVEDLARQAEALGTHPGCDSLAALQDIVRTLKDNAVTVANETGQE